MFYSEESATFNKDFELKYEKERLNSSFKKFYGRYKDLFTQYEVPFSRMINGMMTFAVDFVCSMLYLRFISILKRFKSL